MVRDGLFLCPHCGHKLSIKEKSLVCENGHCFDVAKSGYVNLLPANRKNSIDPGDNKEMIAARVRVMNNGYYRPLAEYVEQRIEREKFDSVLDAGCGTGYIADYLKNKLRDTLVIGTDISKHAIEQASKLSKQVNFAVASSKRLPIEEKSVSAVICAFAPVYAEEFARVTKENGLLLRVVPAKNHLYNLKEFLYEEPRYNEEDDAEFAGYEKESVKTVKGVFEGNADDIKALVKMTPYYYHTSQEKLSKLDEVKTLSVNTEFEVRIFRKTKC